jgi:hypothetical protein
VNAADAIKALAKARSIPTLLLAQIGTLPLEMLQAVADWLDGGDGPEPLEALNKLPDTLRSELALARAEARAKAEKP